MPESYRVAVVGATGLVGRQILERLAARQFPARQVRALASARSVGQRLGWGVQTLTVELACAAALADVDLVLMSAGSAVSAALAPAAAAAGALVVDNSAHFRLDPEVPLVVPEANEAALARRPPRGIVANPNCATIQLVVALAPLQRAVPLRRLVLSTYQAVSGRGRAGLDELTEQVRALAGGEAPVPRAFPRRIAFNCLPHIGPFTAAGDTQEEAKMVAESRKILEHPALAVGVTCVRVPVFNGHAIAVSAAFAQPLSVARARALWAAAPGLRLVDDGADDRTPTPLDADGGDATLVGRLRPCGSAADALAFWCVADNLRKGAATNAVQVAEALARRGHLRAC